MTRYEAIEKALRHARNELASAPHSMGYEFTALKMIDAALALPEDSKVVNAELYELAVQWADARAKQFAGLSIEYDRYLSLREASGEPMPYKVIREGDKVRFE